MLVWHLGSLLGGPCGLVSKVVITKVATLTNYLLITPTRMLKTFHTMSHNPAPQVWNWDLPNLYKPAT